MKYIPKARAYSLTAPLFEAWKSLNFEEKWGKNFTPAPLPMQNSGCIAGPDGIKGFLEFYFMHQNGDGGILIQLTYGGSISSRIAKVTQTSPFEREKFVYVPIEEFDEYIKGLIS